MGLEKEDFNNKVIGTRGQGVGEGCPRELTTEHLKKASLRLDKPLPNSLGLRPISYLSTVKIWYRFPSYIIDFWDLAQNGPGHD